jgi:ubiquinone biosynthesis protein UbiJ
LIAPGLITASLFERSLNHLLRQTPGAAQQLRRHAGRSLRFDLTLAQFDFCIADDGCFSEAAVANPDAVIRPTPALFVRLPFFGREALQHAEYSGDAALLYTLDLVFRSLAWDAEADLAPVLGNIAAHRINVFGREALHTLRHAAQSLNRSASEYVVEEAGLMARKVDVARFNREVDTLIDDAARLEKRLARLESSRK